MQYNFNRQSSLIKKQRITFLAFLLLTIGFIPTYAQTIAEDFDSPTYPAGTSLQASQQNPSVIWFNPDGGTHAFTLQSSTSGKSSIGIANTFAGLSGQNDNGILFTHAPTSKASAYTLRELIGIKLRFNAEGLEVGFDAPENNTLTIEGLRNGKVVSGKITKSVTAGSHNAFKLSANDFTTAGGFTNINQIRITLATPSSGNFFLDAFKYQESCVPFSQFNTLTGFSSNLPSTISLGAIDVSASSATGYVVKINNQGTFTKPVDGAQLPQADLSWNNAGEQVVYVGTQLAINQIITGLSPDTNYWLQVYAYNDCSGTYKFDQEVENAKAVQLKTRAKLTPTLNISNITKTYGDAAFDLNAISKSSGTISYAIINQPGGTSLAGKRVTIGNAGEVTIRVSITADANYTTLSKDIKLTIQKVVLTVTADDKTRPYLAPNPVLTLRYSGFIKGEDERVLDKKPIGSYGGGITPNTPPGKYAIYATGGQDNNYSFNKQSGTLTITKLNQQINNFTGDIAKSVYDANFLLKATTTSGLSITYTSSNPAVAKIIGNSVDIVGQGTAQITATQGGDFAYNPATSVSRRLVVDAGNPEIEVTDGSNNIVSGTGVFDYGTLKSTDREDDRRRSFTVRNTGNGDLTFASQVTISGAHAADFELQDATLATLQPSQSARFKVIFNPSGTGVRTATVTIKNNDQNEGNYTFTIKGKGTPEMNIRRLGSSVSVVSGNSQYGLGEVALGNASFELFFEIENEGSNAPLTLTGTPVVAVTGTNPADFEVVKMPKASIVSGGKETFSIRFKPTQLGERTATISIVNDDPDENPYTFIIKGIGVEPPEVNIKIGNQDIASGSGKYDFGSISGPTEVIFTIENTGKGKLWLNGTPRVTVSGANASEFEWTTWGGNLILAGKTSTFGIKFTPSAIGTRTAKISIQTNDPDENPYTFTVQATSSVAPEIVVKARTQDLVSGAGMYDFGEVSTSAEATFTIENTGNTVLNLTGATPVKITGANATDFEVVEVPATKAIDANATTTFKLKFTPLGDGDRVAQISIDNNDADESPFTFTIQGRKGSVTGLANIPMQAQLRVGPNPATDLVRLYFTKYRSNEVQYQWVDQKGSVVLQNNATIGNDGRVTIDISKLAEGQYFLKLQLGEEVLIKKVYKH